jgi:phosphoglucomutase
MDAKLKYQEWLSNPYFDEMTKEELKSISGNEKEIKERFYKNLEFGTAGLRGIIGAGTNRINQYTVRKATQGLANYIKKCNSQKNCVAIAYDSRRFSKEFATEAALCLAANGVKAYIFESLRSTPELSFAVRTLNAIAGINITASHNPPEYNGYKVYWEDGAQITPPHDIGIMEEVSKIEDYTTLKTTTIEQAKKDGLYQEIGKEIDDAYIQVLKDQVYHLDAIKEVQDDLKIVYSPLHGTGNIPVRRVLKELGFDHVYVVKEQELPDSEFSTVSYPNPEADETFELGLKLAKEVGAELVIATDPDADRLGVRVRDKDGDYHTLTGNMSGALLADYLIGQRKALKGLPKDGYLVKTIVTSNLIDSIADYYNVELIEVLTGFKYIGQKILESEHTGVGEYLFGLEESYGCLIGTYARDKDAVAAAMSLCEAAAYYKTKGMTLWDAMLDIYKRCGYHYDDVMSIELKGIEGIAKIQEILATLRAEPPAVVGNLKVKTIRDYQTGIINDLTTGEKRETNLPDSNVLFYDLEEESWFCARPSGTEPKIKFYSGVVGETLEDSKTKSAKLGVEIEKMLKKML